jgi:hypothetical protein
MTAAGTGELRRFNEVVASAELRRETLVGDRKKAYDTARDEAKQLSDQCKKFLRVTAKINPADIISAINKQVAFDGTTSTNSLVEAGLRESGTGSLIFSPRNCGIPEPYSMKLCTHSQGSMKPAWLENWAL